MATIIKDLGAVSAYAYAVEKGYTGTEEEFAELMADYADVGQRAEDAADSALNSKTAAQTAAQTATTKASEASTSATSASGSASAASASASQASESATNAANSATGASGSATSAATSASTATTKASEASASATAAQTAQTAAEAAQTAAETAQEAAETAAATFETDTTLTVPGKAADAKVTGDEISDLKSELKADELTQNNIIIYDETRTIAGSASWPQRTFTKNLIKINGSFSENRDNYFTQMDNPNQYATTTSAVNNWNKNIPLVAEHTYKFTGIVLSGSVTIPDGETLTYNAKDSDNNIVFTCGYNDSVMFKPQASGNFVFYFHAQKNSSFADAVLAYTLIDVTEIASLDSKSILNILDNFSVNVFSKYATDYITGKGYSGTTGNIVDSVNNIITGFIPVIAGDGIQCFVNGKNITNEYVDAQIRKITLYNSEKTWEKTENVNGMNIEYYPITEDGFVRFMLRRTDYIEIFVSSITKNDKLVDLILFAGQSNMAGRGGTSTEHPETAPTVIPGAGYEFKSITDTTKLYPITEPFGVNENNPGGDAAGIDDGNKKTGDMIPAFVNAYYMHNGGVPVVGVSASEGGSSSAEWIPETGNNFVDLAARLDTARKWLVDNGYSIRHQYCVWCQGESDGDNIYSGSETIAEYETRARAIFNGLIALGLEKVLLIRIGNYNGTATGKSYTTIIDWQTEEAQINDALVMVSCDFAGMKTSGMMKDDFHYYQIGYNITGNSAGVNSAFYASTGKEPTMYDPENNNLYYSHKN